LSEKFSAEFDESDTCKQISPPPFGKYPFRATSILTDAPNFLSVGKKTSA
jgi:hypothetical protein